MNLIQFIKGRFSNRPDSEHQQALVRLAIGVFMSIYMLPDAFAQQNYVFIQGVAVFLASISAIPLWILLDPQSNPARRVCGIVVDMAAIGAAMILSGSHAIPIFILYLWVTSGNGFRFGQTYLFIALVLGLFSLAAVSAYSDFFRANSMLGIELGIGYTLFTFYVNSLVKQLYEAINVAKSASNAKQTFLSTMSHELRTPLHAIAGLTSLLKGESADRKKSLDLIGSVETAVKQMLGIVNDILDFAKIEAGKVEIVKEPVDLDALNISMAKMFSGQAKEKKLNFKTYFSPKLPVAFVSDESRIRQVIGNLLSNAIKFTEQGEILLSVEPAVDKKGAACIKWSIKDTGIGIPEETIAKIFESFSQADASTSRKYGGTGLGTTIAREFVLLLGGDIGIESAVGKGTTFWFTLPCITQGIEIGSQEQRWKVPLLSLIPETNTDVLNVCRHFHGLVLTNEEAIALEISKDSPDAVGLLVQAVAGELPPLAHYAVTKGMKLIVLDHNASPERKREFIRLGAFAICEQVEELPRALKTLHAWSGLDVESRPPAAQSYVSGKRILIADDNLTNLQILTAILEMHEHVVTQVNCGEDALEQFFERDFDMFVFDMNMPDITGLELTKILRAMGMKHSRNPVAILTADATAETERMTLDAGANLFITKPITPEDLLRKVDALFADNPSSPADTSSAAPKKEHLVFNQEAMQELLKISPAPDFFSILVESYLEESVRNMQLLQEAFKLQDYGMWRRALHAMKSSAMNMQLECLGHSLHIAHELTPDEFKAQSKTILGHIEAEAERGKAALLLAASQLNAH